MSLSVLVPKTITESIYFSSTVPEPDLSGPNPDPALYNPATTYALGAFVSRPNHRIYRSRVSSNLGNTPENSPTQWADVRPTNKWAMFDGLISTGTKANTSMSFVLKPGFYNTIYFGGIEATSIMVTQRDEPGGNIVFQQTYTIRLRTAPAWYEWLFGEFESKSDLLITGLIPRSNSELTVDILGGTISIGILALGNLVSLGKTQYGARALPNDFSYVKTDEFGVTTVVRRDAANDVTLTAWLKRSEADKVHQTLMNLRGTPAVWIGSDLQGYAGLRTYGLGKGEISYDLPNDCRIDVNVKGFI